MTDTDVRLYTAAEVAAARAAGEESARESWSKFHDIAIESLELKHRHELAAVQESLGIEQRRNRVDLDKLVTANEDALLLVAVRTAVRDPKPSWRAARRAYATVHRLVYGGGLQ